MTPQKGMALVLVLWILSLLTIMAGSFALSMRRESAIVAGIKNNAQASAVAESGIAMAEMMLLNTDPVKGWRADGSIYEISTADATIRVRLSSEAGKIDINKVDEKLLNNLMINAPIDEEQQTKMVSAILDWRDEDDLVHIDGAEKQEYKDAGLNYQPGNKPFQSIEELQLVLGMNKSLFLWLEPLITIYSGQPQVNLQVATKEVLLVMPDLDQGLVDSYVTARLQSAINNLPAPPSPSSSGINPTGQNNMLTIVSESIMDDESRASVTVVIKKKSGDTQTTPTPFEVFKSQHATVNSTSLFTDAMSELLVKQYAEPELNN
ncbi:general secretion pathway protein GspK [Methylobacter sp. S3L5C]|uniref:general secretion pathway protein GspK n=1 Tax=Methylobacter sp. S3L5C TaxID=2839024 RepID=UPI001FAB7ACF|nr:type II secretion system protein GspK [Methylobacter sp. S3L5C]UOA09662.1 general secretion pathway protein GspK [Methylobacter sp. S3L5C]